MVNAALSVTGLTHLSLSTHPALLSLTLPASTAEGLAQVGYGWVPCTKLNRRRVAPGLQPVPSAAHPACAYRTRLAHAFPLPT